MNFSNIFFNKNLDNLEYQDIVDFFIDEKEESDKIEFKSFSPQYGNLNSSIEGIVRGICAFLNSEGGIIIWGAPQGTARTGTNEKIFLGNLSPVNEYKEKDWLINKISGLITPLPVGINVKVLSNGQEFLYIFEVQASNCKPHQFKNIYYARLDGQTKPAPHYLVEALFRQIKYPNIEGFIKFASLRRNYDLKLEILFFNFSQLQNEENISFRLMCPQGKFERLSPSDTFAFGGHQLVKEGAINLLHFGQPEIFHAALKFNMVEMLGQHNNQIDLILTFGGKNSPAKISSYKLELNNINWETTKSINELLVEVKENELFSQIQESKGSTREGLLKQLLER